MSFSATVLAHSPLAYWRLGDAVGSGTAADASGNGRTLTASGITFGATGLLTGDSDTAAALSGSQDTHTTASAAWANLTALTTLCLFKTSTGGVQSLLDRDDEVTRQFQFRVNGSTDLEFIGFSGGATTTIAGSTTMIDGARHLGVVVVNGTSLKLYVDGVPVATGTMGGNLDGGGSSVMGLGYHTAGAGQQSFTGTLDEAAVIGSALSDADVAALWASATGVVAGSGSLTLAGSVGAGPVAGAAGSLTLSGSATPPVAANGSLTFGSPAAVARPVYLASFTVDVGIEASDTPLLPADVPTVDYVGDDDSDLVDYPEPGLDGFGRPVGALVTPDPALFPSVDLYPGTVAA